MVGGGFLKRNPNYGGERPQHLDAIVYETGIDTGPAAKRIEAGTLDYASECYPDSGVFVSAARSARPTAVSAVTAGHGGRRFRMRA